MTVFRSFLSLLCVVHRLPSVTKSRPIADIDVCVSALCAVQFCIVVIISVSVNDDCTVIAAAIWYDIDICLSPIDDCDSVTYGECHSIAVCICESRRRQNHPRRLLIHISIEIATHNKADSSISVRVYSKRILCF